MHHLLPTEIYSNILSYMSIKDLVRLERTCRLFQSFALCEIERRLIHSGSTSDEWGILVKHLSILFSMDTYTHTFYTIDSFGPSLCETCSIRLQNEKNTLFCKDESRKDQNHVRSPQANPLLAITQEFRFRSRSPQKRTDGGGDNVSDVIDSISILLRQGIHYQRGERNGRRKNSRVGC